MGPAVRLVVELLEEEEEHDGVHADPPDESTRVVAVDEQQLESVNHDGHKLCLCKHKQLITVHNKPIAANLYPRNPHKVNRIANIRVAVYKFVNN